MSLVVGSEKESRIETPLVKESFVAMRKVCGGERRGEGGER